MNSYFALFIINLSLILSFRVQARIHESLTDLTITPKAGLTVVLSQPEVDSEALKTFLSLSAEDKSNFLRKREHILQLIAEKIVNHQFSFSTFLTAKNKLSSAVKIQTYTQAVKSLFHLVSQKKSEAGSESKIKSKDQIFLEGLQEILKRIDSTLFGLSNKIATASEMKLDTGAGLVFGLGFSKMTLGFGVVFGVSIVQDLDGEFQIHSDRFIEISRADRAYIPSLMSAFDYSNSVTFETHGSAGAQDSYHKKYLPMGLMVYKGDCVTGVGFTCGVGFPPIVTSLAIVDFKSKRFHFKSLSESYGFIKNRSLKFVKNLVSKIRTKAVTRDSMAPENQVCTYFLN